MSEAVVEFDGVCKRFRRGAAHDSLRDLIAGGLHRMLRAGRRRADANGARAAGVSPRACPGGGDAQARPATGPRSADDDASEPRGAFWALRDVSFTVARGEALGVIGPNGAGKSTALRLLAGILRPDQGRVNVRGRLAALIEVGAGFHGDLTGRENIFLSGAILGMTRRETRLRLDDIVSFAGIGPFLDTPVKRYSSGMYARLGFSIAAHVDPDVLLVDEVLSVGDAVFRLRCMERMRELIARGVTLVFVTHNLDQMRAVCPRALVLDRGAATFLGSSRDAVAHYMSAMSHAPPAHRTDQPASGDGGAVEMLRLRFFNGGDEEIAWVHPDECVRAELTLRVHRAIPRMVVELNMRQAAHENLLSLNSGRDDRTFHAEIGEHVITLALPAIPVSGGPYLWNVRAWDADRSTTELDTPFRTPLMFDDRGRSNGVLCVPHTWRHVARPEGEPCAGVADHPARGGRNGRNGDLNGASARDESRGSGVAGAAHVETRDTALGTSARDESRGSGVGSVTPMGVGRSVSAAGGLTVCILGDARSVHLRRIVPGLVARGLRVHLVTHHPIQIPGATVERFRVPDVGRGYLAPWRGRWTRYLASLFDRFDVVHVHFMHDWGLTPDVARRGCLMVTPWGSDIVDPPGEEPPTLEHVDRRRALLRRADGVTAWGPWFARAIARYAGIDVNHIALLPLGVDVARFKPADPCDRPQGVPPRVGFFKGFRTVYGATTLMRAIPTVVEALSDVRFDLVGDGPERQRCVQLAGELGVEAYVNWFPPQAHANIPHFLAGWNLTVVPSLRESFGAAALESSAVAVPVIASRVGGLVDTVVDGHTGLFVPPGQPEQLADAIITLIRDDSMRARMGQAGRRFVVEHYEWGAILDRWVSTYQAVRERRAVMV